MHRRGRNARLWLLIAVVVLTTIAFAPAANAGPLPGAVFTTLVDGSAVNHNIYPTKEDVYLDGGPGNNAPSTAAGLPSGDYYLQVTDPSGKVLLSADPIASRKFHVNAAGVIDYVYPAPTTTKYKGKTYGTHLTSIDQDHAALGAITVQLMPYADTPNPGGVYKVWVTPVDKYTPGQGKFGFIPAWSKTDNFKAKGKPFTPPILIVRNFDDANANGIWDLGEVEIFGWTVDVTDPLGVTNTYYTQVGAQASTPGTYTTYEQMPPLWQQTALYVDGVAQAVSSIATVGFAGNSGEIHTVIYGKIQRGRVHVGKFYDKFPDGVYQHGIEPMIAGWSVRLDGTAVNGTVVHLADYTGTLGCLEWNPLPGHYFVSEVMPTVGNWQATTPTCFEITVTEGGEVHVCFGNVATGYAGFLTKGYWHNKNGLSQTTLADLAYLNSLRPWWAPSSYFDAGDEPIDGYFANGTPVAAAKGDWGETIAPVGSPWAEQAHFLVDANAGGDPREQLAQQLDAFVMNAIHELGDPTSAIQLPDGTWIGATDLINQACDTWLNGSASEQNSMSVLLDSLNNDTMVWYVLGTPPVVVY